MSAPGTPVNNRTPKQLRLAEYEGGQGALFLLLDSEQHVYGLSNVILSAENGFDVAKIYGRFHLRPEAPQTVIDHYFEPATFAWCKERGVERLFVTVNKGHLRTWGLLCRRIARSRGRINPHLSEGQEFRVGFQPYARMILERNTWQYVIYYSPDGRFPLSREERPLDPEAWTIAKESFPDAP